MGYRLNHLDKPILMAVPKPVLPEFGIHDRLESCACLPGKFMTPHLSFQQLPSLGLFVLEGHFEVTLRPSRALHLDANIASKTPERYKDVKCVELGAEVSAELKLGTTDANCDCVFVKNALVSNRPQIREARAP